MTHSSVLLYQGTIACLHCCKICLWIRFPETGCADSEVISRECPDLTALIELLQDLLGRPGVTARADEVFKGVRNDSHAALAMRTGNLVFVPVFHHVLAKAPANKHKFPCCPVDNDVKHYSLFKI